VVILDAMFEAVLATVLLFGIAYTVIDETDFPGPASNVVIAVFALALYVLAVVLMTVVKNEATTDRLLNGLAVTNGGLALLLVLWTVVAEGFSAAGKAVVWTTIAVLGALALSQALAARRR
jgi:thiol:disulfide interchange protein